MAKKKEGFFSDTLALLIYGVVGGIVPFFFENIILGLSVKQWAGIRILYLSRYIGGYICGRMADFFRRHFCRIVADIIALCIYELPIYIASALIVRASFRQIFLGSVIQIISNAIFGWLYGFILDRMRAV